VLEFHLHFYKQVETECNVRFGLRLSSVSSIVVMRKHLRVSLIRLFDNRNAQLLETEVLEIPLHDPVLWVHLGA
jgi:hypothetical protein